MFLTGRAAWAAIVFIFLTTGISGPRAKSLASGASPKQEINPGGGASERDQKTRENFAE